MKQSSPTELAEMFKSLVRPIVICSAWIAWLSMVVAGAEIPGVLTGIASAITGEYIIERAVKRFKE